MKKINHLIKTQDFSQVLRHKHRFHSSSLTLYYRPNNSENLRVGLSVSKKIGKAHERVRIRRQLRAMMDLIDRYDRGFDIVIIVRPSYKEHSFQEVLKEVKDLIGKFIKEETDEQKI